MKITLLVVGRTVDKNIIAAIDDYTGRVKHFAPFDIEVIPELKNARKLSEAQQKEAEAELILKSLNSGDTVVLLDEGGKEFRSTEFAAHDEYQPFGGHLLLFLNPCGKFCRAELLSTFVEQHHCVAAVQ